jgi:hypothetical protein
MSSIDRYATLLTALALSGGILTASTGAFASTIVVRSNGPSAKSYPPGTKLPDNGTIVLRPGDTVTVLDAHGTRVLRGGSASAAVPVAGNGAATVNGIAALIADNGQRQTRTGATRGRNTAPRPTNVWQIDTTRGGTFCVVDARALALWRPVTETGATLTLIRAGDGKAAPVDFRAGQAVRDWPVDALAVENGTRVRVTGAAGTEPVSFVLKLLPTVPVTLDETAAVLLAQGCTAQLDLLVDATTGDPTD